MFVGVARVISISTINGEAAMSQEGRDDCRDGNEGPHALIRQPNDSQHSSSLEFTTSGRDSLQCKTRV